MAAGLLGELPLLAIRDLRVRRAARELSSALALLLRLAGSEGVLAVVVVVVVVFVFIVEAGPMVGKSGPPLTSHSSHSAIRSSKSWQTLSFCAVGGANPLRPHRPGDRSRTPSQNLQHCNEQGSCNVVEWYQERME